jgi:hypothetical protein
MQGFSKQNLSYILGVRVKMGYSPLNFHNNKDDLDWATLRECEGKNSSALSL